MRLLGSLPTESEASLLTAWLLTQSIDCHVDPQRSESGFEIWVKDEDGFPTAKAEFAEFKQNPKAEKYRSAVAQAKQIHQEQVAKQKLYQKNVRTGPVQKGIFETAPLTMVLTLICVVVSVLTDFGSSEKHEFAVARALQFVAVDSPSDELQRLEEINPDSLDLRLASIYRGELWRTVSPIFYHYGTFHIIFNLYWLIYFGRIIEGRYGTLSMAMIVVFSAIFSNVLQCVVPASVGGTVPFLTSNLLITAFGGMSGVIYGLFGFIWFRMLYDPSSRLKLPQVTVILMIVYLVYCMVAPQIGSVTGGESGSRVANWAHGGGMVMGMLLGLSPIGKMFKK